jgi:hypothetical protein
MKNEAPVAQFGVLSQNLAANPRKTVKVSSSTAGPLVKC